LLLGYKPVQHVTVPNTAGNCNTVVSIVQWGVLKRTNATTNTCYNERILQRTQMLQRTHAATNECYNEHRCYNERMLQWTNTTTNTDATTNECYNERGGIRFVLFYAFIMES